MSLLNNMSRKNLYTGRAGHLAVMAELLLRGWNTAIPEVDIGDDIFVVRDSDGNMHRVQVKTATAEPRKYGYSAEFYLPLSQLRTPIRPEITYIFVTRRDDRWGDFVVINRETLNKEYYQQGIGSENKGRLKLWLCFRGTSIICSQSDLSQYRNDWVRHFPIIHH